MKKTKRKVTPPEKREAIVAEYLAGGVTLRQLGKKYKMDYRNIYQWVAKFRGKGRFKQRIVNGPFRKQVKAMPLSPEVIELQAELRKAHLKNLLLNEMLRLSENLTGIELRKKYGAKQS